MKRSSLMIAVLLVMAALFALFAVVSGTSPVTEKAMAAEACPADPPPSSYAQAAIDWVRTRDGGSSPSSRDGYCRFQSEA